MELLRDHLRQAGVYDLLGAGVVFTGGGSRLNALLEVADDILRRPVRLGYPVPIAKLPSNLLGAGIFDRHWNGVVRTSGAPGAHEH